MSFKVNIMYFIIFEQNIWESNLQSFKDHTSCNNYLYDSFDDSIKRIISFTERIYKASFLIR